MNKLLIMGARGYAPKNNKGTQFKKMIHAKKIKPDIGIEDGTALCFKKKESLKRLLSQEIMQRLIH